MENEQKQFQKITPVSNMNLESYGEALDFVFSENDLNNIALSGSYSSGKSSLIRTYAREHAKKLYYISLTHFRGNNDDQDAPFPKETIERKIVNQLVQQAPIEKVEKAGFHNGEASDCGKRVPYYAGITVFLICACLLSKYELWFDLAQSWHDIIAVGVPTLLLVAISILLYCGIKTVSEYQIKHKIIRSIRFKGAEAQLSDDDSYFDKHLNEIILLLCDLEVDGIVFEDLDRIESIEVFERLRELNSLANLRKKDKAKPIRFFYLLKDEIFCDCKDRTKFFDFIIPVIPVIDSSNSYNKLKEHLEKIGNYSKIHDTFLRSVSLYVDDYRILKNVCNEYVIYESKLNKIDLDHTKLIALILYKNLFPKDFADLQAGRGLIYSIIQSKKKLIEENTTTLKKELRKLDDRIQASEDEFIKDTKELDYLMEGMRQKNFNEYNSFVKNEEQLRRQRIIDKSEEVKKELQEEKKQLETEISSLGKSLLETLLDKKTMTMLFNGYVPEYEKHISKEAYDSIINSPYCDLLKYLLSHGYIDENYADYISYFYENSLDTNDKIFVRSVKEGSGLSYNYKLHNAKEVLTYLDDTDLDQYDVLNVNLFDFVLEYSQKKYSKQLIECIQDNNAFDFIKEYISSGKRRGLFVSTILDQWPDFFKKIINIDIFNDDLIRFISYLAINECTSEVLSKANIDGCFTSWISDDTNYLNNHVFLNSDEFNISSIINNLRELNVKFKNISTKNVNNAMLEEIYQNDLYEINDSNIKLFLSEKCDYGDVDLVLPVLMTKVLQSDEPLFKYLNSNIDKTIPVYLQMIDKTVSDSCEIITDILNHRDIGDDKKISYIESLDTYIEHLGDIENKAIWNTILKNNVAVYSVNNVLTYFTEFGLDGCLISFINNNDDNLDYSTGEKAIVVNFADRSLRCNELSDQKYLQIAKNLQQPMADFKTTGIDISKVKGLIDYGIIPVTESNLRFIRANYNDAILDFIRHDIDAYIDLARGDFGNIDETYKILESDEIEDKKKLSLLKITSEKLSVKDIDCSDSILSFILQNLLDVNDISCLLKTYGKRSDYLQSVILEVLKKHSDAVITNSNAADEIVVIDLCRESDWPLEKKCSLIKGSIQNISRASIIVILKDIGATKIAEKLSGSRREVEVNNQNEEILNTLHEAGVIEDYGRRRGNTNKYKGIRFKDSSRKS